MNLERLAELINAKWPDKWVGKSRFDGTGLTVHDKLMLDIFGKTVDNTEAWVSYYPENGSHHNGAFLDWCLDRLEELGREPQLSCKQHGFFRLDMSNPIRVGFIKAPTRAEACALALMQALEGE